MKKYIIIATLTLVIGFIRFRSKDNYRYAINEGMAYLLKLKLRKYYPAITIAS